MFRKKGVICGVAPHTGAWIETLDELIHISLIMSHPTRVRGLKLLLLRRRRRCRVAPHTGAWIETNITGVAQKLGKSHPTRVRGLKQPTPLETLAITVAPHTGAWIETTGEVERHSLECRTPHGCVD